MTAKRILIMLVTLAATGSAVEAADDDFILRDHLTLSASDRVRGEFVSWFDPGGPKSNNSYNFFANRLRFGATLSVTSIELVVEGQDTRLVNLPGADSINTGTGTANVGPLGPGALYFTNTHTRDQGELFLHLGYATLRNLGLPGVSARVGRFGYNLGLEKVAQDPSLAWLQRARISQRLIGNFDYTNVGRSFDGVQALYDYGPFNLTAMASHPTFGGFNVNANKEIDKIDLVSATASVVEPKGLAPLSAQFFYIYYGDRRNLVVTDNRRRDLLAGEACANNIRSCDTKDISISTMGVDLVHVVDLGPGKLDLLAWVAGQVGDWESLEHRAWAVAAEVGYQFPNVALKPWVRLNYFRSSGDHNNADDEHETFFQLIPTARTYALFPFFNLMNNQDLFLQTILKPLPGLTAAVTGHWLRVTDANDLWYAGGGATSNTFFGYSGIPAKGWNELGYLTDIELTYVFNKHLTMYGYYGRAFGQGAVSANFVGNNADYGYIEATVSF